MDRQSFTDLIQTKFKMVRIEAGYTQDTMAQTIGLSKKTLVQIEKERVLPNWTTCISICALFRDSEVLNSTFGCDPLEIVQEITVHIQTMHQQVIFIGITLRLVMGTFYKVTK